MKSHASTLCELAVCVLRDATALCAANESAERDIETLISRVEHEGLSFLTITLPSFSSDFERSLELGEVGSECFRSFRKYRRIPAFLRGIVSLVFDADTGRILNEPSVCAVKCVRQIGNMFKKLKLACSPQRVSKAFVGYLQDERDLERPISQADVSHFDSVCKCLWSGLSSDRMPSITDTIPKHGPGATEDKTMGNQKFVFSRWHDRLEPYFPLDSFAFANVNALDSEGFEKLSIVPVDDEPPVRVITVPKTLKTPRIIAIEPVCMQYTQQAISRILVRFLESSRMTAGHVNFTDQTVNQKLAIISSQTRSMATLDMSSASDRVPLSLATCLFQSNPDLLGAILACRSRTARLPSGQVIALKKFASMGSALCFPVESMYFYTICVGALLVKRNLPVTSQNIFKVSRDVYVYGDDIIVPANEAAAVVGHLQKYFCKVNMSKSFWSGNFRESCGMDAFQGERVTPVYLREMPPDDRRNPSALISWVKSANQFYLEGFWLTSSRLLARCERILGRLPLVRETCAGLGKVSLQRVCSIERWNKRYQCPEVRTWVAAPVYRTDRLDGYPALLKCLLKLEDRLSNGPLASDKKHLDRSARYGAVTLQRRWVSPY